RRSGAREAGQGRGPHLAGRRSRRDSATLVLIARGGSRKMRDAPELEVNGRRRLMRRRQRVVLVSVTAFTILAVCLNTFTRLVDIKVEHNDPEAARMIADHLARLFVEYQSRRAAGPDGNLAPQAPAEIADVEQGGDPQETLSAEPNFAPRAALEARIKHLDERIASLNAEHARAQ